LSQPHRSLGVVSQLVISIRMDQNRQRPPVDDKPGNESTKLFGREYVNLKHGNRMRANRSIPYSIDAQLREFATYAFPQLVGEFDLFVIGLEKVNVGVKAPSYAVV